MHEEYLSFHCVSHVVLEPHRKMWINKPQHIRRIQGHGTVSTFRGTSGGGIHISKLTWMTSSMMLRVASGIWRTVAFLRMVPIIRGGWSNGQRRSTRTRWYDWCTITGRRARGSALMFRLVWVVQWTSEWRKSNSAHKNTLLRDKMAFLKFKTIHIWRGRIWIVTSTTYKLLVNVSRKKYKPWLKDVLGACRRRNMRCSSINKPLIWNGININANESLTHTSAKYRKNRGVLLYYV